MKIENVLDTEKKQTKKQRHLVKNKKASCTGLMKHNKSISMKSWSVIYFLKTIN